MVIRSGAYGVDDFISWLATRVQICSDDERSRHAWNRKISQNDRQSPIAGTCFGGGCARRAGAWQSRACGRHAAQGAPSSAGVRLERLLHRRPYRLRPRHLERGALRSAVGLDQQCRQRRDRRRARRLQCAPAVRTIARRRSRSDVSELFHLELDRLHRWPARAPKSSRNWIMSEPRAAASAMPAATGSFTPPAASPLPASASSTRPHVGIEEKHINVRPGWAAGAGLEYAFAPHWSVRLEYLYSQFDRANVRFPSGTEHTSTLDFQSGAHRPQPQGRLAGINELDAEDRSDRSRIRSLGNPRPDHLSGAGLSGIPRALYRHQQPDAGAAGTGDLEQQPLSERPALGRRRGLLQSRTAAGIRLERHRRPRRISQRRGAEVELPLPALQHLAAVSCARPSDSAASRKSLPADSSSSRARSTSTG